jgi:lysophospholipase L1-like esterase
MTTNTKSVNSRNSIFARNPKITIFFVITISVLILDVVLTNIFLHTEIKNNDQLPGVKPPILGVRNEIYHHDLIKNGMIEAKYTQDYLLSLGIGKAKLFTNSLGFKDKSSRTIPLLPSKNFTKRIVFIGDSFTEGIFLEYEDTFVGIIDKELNKKSIQVLNAGVGSYSPIIYWRKVKYLIEEVGLKFNELAVFIDMSDLCDEKYRYRLSKRGHVIDPNPYPVDNPFPPPINDSGFTDQIKKIIHSQTTLLHHATNVAYDLINRDQVNFSFARRSFEFNAWDKIPTTFQQMRQKTMLQLVSCLARWSFDKFDPDVDKTYSEFRGDRYSASLNDRYLEKEYDIQKMKKYMDKLHQLTRDNNIKLTIAVYPWPFQVWFEDLNSVHVKIWEEWSRRNNVNFINYFPDFVSEGLTKKDKKEVVEKYYIPFDVHFNKQGNKLMAKKFLEKYFPERHF